MSQVTIKNLAQYGVVSDIAAFETPANAWTDARNVSFEGNGVNKSGNRSIVLTPTPAIVNKIYSKGGKVYFTTVDRVYQANSLTNVDISKGGSAYNATDEWFITELSNVIVFNNNANTPQYLGIADTKLKDLPNWGLENGSQMDWRAGKIRAFKNFLIAIGIQESGVELTQRVRWSDLALPNAAPQSWDSFSTTNSAGFNDLSEARGKLVDGLAMGEYFFLYTTQEVFVMTYTAGTDIFTFRKVFDNLSILAPECVCQIRGGHFLVTTSDIVIHNGSTYQSVVTDKIKRQLFEVIGSADSEKVRVQYYPSKDEVWVLYPSSTGADLDRVAIFNVTNGTWTFRDVPNITAISYGVIPSDDDKVIDTQTQVINTDSDVINGIGQDFVRGSLYCSTSSLTWYALDEGTAGTENLPCTLIKQNIDFDEWGAEPTTHKQIKGIYPQVKGSGQLMISVGVSENPYDSPNWSEAQVFNVATDRKVDFRTTGRYISVRFQSFGKEDWTLLSFSIDGQVRGGR